MLPYFLENLTTTRWKYLALTRYTGSGILVNAARNALGKIVQVYSNPLSAATHQLQLVGLTGQKPLAAMLYNSVGQVV